MYAFKRWDCLEAPSILKKGMVLTVDSEMLVIIRDFLHMYEDPRPLHFIDFTKSHGSSAISMLGMRSLHQISLWDLDLPEKIISLNVIPLVLGQYIWFNYSHIISYAFSTLESPKLDLSYKKRLIINAPAHPRSQSSGVLKELEAVISRSRQCKDTRRLRSELGLRSILIR